MKYNEEAFLRFVKNPVKIAITFYLSALLVIGLGYLCRFFGMISFDEQFPWLVMATMTLFYAMFANAMILLREGGLFKIMRHTFYSFILLLVAGVLAAWIISGKSVYDVGHYKTVYVVLILAFLLFISIAAAIKVTMRFLDKRDRSRFMRDNDPDKIHWN